MENAATGIRLKKKGRGMKRSKGEAPFSLEGCGKRYGCLGLTHSSIGGSGRVKVAAEAGHHFYNRCAKGQGSNWAFNVALVRDFNILCRYSPQDLGVRKKGARRGLSSYHIGDGGGWEGVETYADKKSGQPLGR